jgi:SAM-dependent methyltransferase
MISEINVPYIPSPLGAIRKMLEIANVSPRDAVYDLGCGDARIPIIAVKEFGAKKAVGCEVRKYVYEKALRKVKNEELLSRVKLVNGDLFKADVSKATVITLYLNDPANEQLKPKLEREAKAGTRIVSRSFPVKGWQENREERIFIGAICLYRMRQT